ncbi:MAG: type II toxin-antitoxin system RnlB family antitoxin [Clostridium celatum]|nr:type II toxin-antitoxin system RnlB family antitoxin [Clostridium celatum]
MNYFIKEQEEFNIVVMNDFKYSVVIIDKTSEPPTYLLPKLKDELISNSISGDILIDSLLYSGNSNERFIKANFIDGDFIKGSFEFVDIERGNVIRKITSDYLRDNQELIEFSILSTMQKRLVIKGCNL